MSKTTKRRRERRRKRKRKRRTTPTTTTRRSQSPRSAQSPSLRGLRRSNMCGQRSNLIHGTPTPPLLPSSLYLLLVFLGFSSPCLTLRLFVYRWPARATRLEVLRGTAMFDTVMKEKEDIPNATLVQFFGTNDYAWVPRNCIKRDFVKEYRNFSRNIPPENAPELEPAIEEATENYVSVCRLPPLYSKTNNSHAIHYTTLFVY